jgi:hypothetical protein
MHWFLSFFLSSFTIRNVCLEILGKSYLLVDDSPLMATVAKASLFDSELLSLVFHY